MGGMPPGGPPPGGPRAGAVAHYTGEKIFSGLITYQVLKARMQAQEKPTEAK